MDRYPTFTALKALEALVRCGNVRQAAKDLHVSIGAVSQQIRILEQDLGHVLFDRSGRSMIATRDATDLAKDIGKGFSVIFGAVDQFRELSRTTHLDIATLPSVANRIVFPVRRHIKWDIRAA